MKLENIRLWIDNAEEREEQLGRGSGRHIAGLVKQREKWKLHVQSDFCPITRLDVGEREKKPNKDKMLG
jgi:hypothetical protein